MVGGLLAAAEKLFPASAAASVVTQPSTYQQRRGVGILGKLSYNVYNNGEKAGRGPFLVESAFTLDLKICDWVSKDPVSDDLCLKTVLWFC